MRRGGRVTILITTLILGELPAPNLKGKKVKITKNKVLYFPPAPPHVPRKGRGSGHPMLSGPSGPPSTSPCLDALASGDLEGPGGTLGYLAGLRLHQNEVRVGTVHDGVMLQGTVDSYTQRWGENLLWCHATRHCGQLHTETGEGGNDMLQGTAHRHKTYMLYRFLDNISKSDFK